MFLKWCLTWLLFWQGGDFSRRDGMLLCFHCSLFALFNCGLKSKGFFIGVQHGALCVLESSMKSLFFVSYTNSRCDCSNNLPP